MSQRSIQERLRDAEAINYGGSGVFYGYPVHKAGVLDEAADLIDKLQCERVELQIKNEGLQQHISTLERRFEAIDALGELKQKLLSPTDQGAKR